MQSTMPRTPFSTPFSSSKKLLETRIRNILTGPQKRPPLPLLALVLAFCFFSVNLVSCQPAQTEENPDDSNFSSADGGSQQKGPVLLGSDSLDRLALNDSRLNDSVTVNSDWSESKDSGGTWAYAGRVEVEVTLDGTDTLAWELEDEIGVFPTLLAARLTDPDRDAIVLELDAFGSTYGGAEYHILEVIDGALTRTLFLSYDDDIPWMEDAKVVDLDYNLLQAIRIPSLVDKWHNSEWYTVEWNGADWNLTPDGYFTDYYDLDVPGHSFTLALRGRLIQPGEPYYPGGPQNTGDWPDPVYDDLIQLYDTGLTSYAFTSQSFTPDPDRPFEGFRWDLMGGGAEIRDINFDGADDFGILCDTSPGKTRCWFIWDEELALFRYAASLGPLEIKDQWLIETRWDANMGRTYPYTYEWNDEGGLTLIQTED